MTPRRLLRLDGRRVSYREAGQGAPVVVITGLGLSGRFYSRSYDAFARAGLRLIVPDLPGFGGTRGRPTGSDVTATREFALAVAAELGVERAIWVGHSIGAQAAIDIAAHAPHRARGVVLVGPTGAPGGPRLLRQVFALAREAWRAPFGDVLHALSDYARTSPVAYAGTWLRFSRDALVEKLDAVRCPALVLVGTRDPVVDPAFLDILLRRLPDAQLRRVPGGTHALPRSRARDFNTVVTEFCRDVSRAAR